jgi:hypothetical protein
MSPREYLTPKRCFAESRIIVHLAASTLSFRFSVNLINSQSPETTDRKSAGNECGKRRGYVEFFQQSGATHLSARSSHVLSRLYLLAGSESNRSDDHQKYLVGMRWVSRFAWKEW